MGRIPAAVCAVWLRWHIVKAETSPAHGQLRSQSPPAHHQGTNPEPTPCLPFLTKFPSIFCCDFDVYSPSSSLDSLSMGIRYLGISGGPSKARITHLYWGSSPEVHAQCWAGTWLGPEAWLQASQEKCLARIPWGKPGLWEERFLLKMPITL